MRDYRLRTRETRNICSHSVDCKLLLSMSHLKIHEIGVALPITLPLDKLGGNVAFKSKTSKAVRRIVGRD